MAKYVIRYTGTDIPGMSNTMAKCLYDHDFIILDVSIASGAGVQSTFVSCEKFKGHGSGRKTNSKEDRIILEKELTNSLKTLCVEHNRASRREVISEFKVSVDEMRDADMPFYNYFYIDVEFQDKKGILAWISHLLRYHFNIENIMDRPILARERDDIDKMTHQDLICVSPRAELYKQVEQFRHESAQADSNVDSTSFLENYVSKEHLSLWERNQLDDHLKSLCKNMVPSSAETSAETTCEAFSLRLNALKRALIQVDLSVDRVDEVISSIFELLMLLDEAQIFTFRVTRIIYEQPTPNAKTTTIGIKYDFDGSKCRKILIGDRRHETR